MTNNLAVFIGDQRDDTIAGFSQFSYEFSLGRLTEGRRNDLVDILPVAGTLIANIKHLADLSTEGYGSQASVC
jgi:hypothetical protein